MAHRHFSLIAVALVGGALALTTACGSSNNNPSPNPTGGSGGTGTGGTGTGGTGTGGTGTGGTAGTGTGGTAGTGTGGTGGTAGSGNCTGTDFPNCYSCAPKTNDQYLNACKGGCQPFDNSTLSELKNGQLPPLP